MAEPMFTIVAKNHLSDDDTLDYTASSSAIDQHDEVLLVDDNGLPCAVPLNQQYQSIDARHDFANGDVGESRVRLRHKLSIACDGLTGSARRKLREMMQDRAEVHFTPGFGRRTELAYRPMSHGFDLTDRHALTRNGDADQNMVWDTERGVMRSWTAATDPRVISTPGGAGQVFERTLKNIAPVDTPASGDLWTALGTGCSVAYEANAFGHNDCPHAMRVTVDNTSVNSLVYQVVTPTAYGEGTFTACVFVKGHVPSGTSFVIDDQTNGARCGEVELDGNYPDWTKIDLQAPCDTTGSALIWAYIHHTTQTSTVTGDYLVGPCAVYWLASASRYTSSGSQWHTGGVTRSLRDSVEVASGFPYPKTGTIHTSFWVPEDFDLSGASEVVGFCGPASVAYQYHLLLLAYETSPRLRAMFYHGYDSTSHGYSYAFVDDKLIPGTVNTITAQMDESHLAIFVNGVDATQGYNDETWQRRIQPSSTDPLYVGRVNTYSNAMGPMPLMTFRVDNEVWDSDRIAQEHATLANPGSLEAIVPARGRTYKIRSIPSTPSTNAGDATWSGTIELEQSGYTAALADITAKE